MQELSKAIRGEIRIDWLSRYLYSTDASAYEILPATVVIPKDADDIATAMEIASRHKIPVTPRGSGTSLSGQAIGTGLIVDFSRHMDHILEINRAEMWVQVESGIILDTLNAALKPFDLMLGPDPASSAVATLGGMIGNNAAGMHSIRYGMTLDHVDEVDVVLADGSRARFGPKTTEEVATLSNLPTSEGRLYRQIPVLIEEYRDNIKNDYPKIWRNVAGYNLNRMLEDMESGNPFNLTPLVVGSEGTLVSVTSARLKLLPRPKMTRLMILHFSTFKSALEAVPLILKNKPAAIELLNRFVLELIRGNPTYGPRQAQFVKGDPEAILIVEFFGEDSADLTNQCARLENALQQDGYKEPIVQCVTPDEVINVWSVRKAELGLLSSQRGDDKAVSFMDDAAVPIENLYNFATEVEQACLAENTEASFAAHASAGCLHITPVVNLKTTAGLDRMHRLSVAIAGIAIKYKGTTTGEHGEGIARSYFNEQLFGARLHQAFKELKYIFDPDNQMNPGKIINAPEPWDPSLMRIQPEYQTPLQPKKTYYDFSADGGFAGLVEMCNGQAVCRRFDIGIMCPSFRITRDEGHSTRGRANALRAAMTGQLGPDGMTSAALYKLLDLCLMCKACKKECPSLVDMTKLKSEFLAQYYEQHGAPLRALMFGHIGKLTELGSLTPGLTNVIFKDRFFKYALDRFIGIDQRRTLPPVAPVTFQDWFKNHLKPDATPNGPVIFWDDCFTSCNSPEIGIAAVKVMEAAGYEVRLAANRRCCGRPMFSKGLLKDAKRNATHNVVLLAPYAEMGIPVVGVEPSCITAFRDEYLDIVGGEAARQVAANSFHIEEFITNLAESKKLNIEFTLPEKPLTILVHGQCYQKSTIGTEPMLKMLRLLPNTTVEEIPSGCCGMAGSFGFEKEHYDLSMKIGEDILFPAIRSASPETAVAAAGTSCRGQITDGTGKNALHPIMIIADRIKV